MASQVVKVRRDKVAACMTCPLCSKLLKEATTISLCLHTFCRKCIYEKLSDEDVDSCPMCNISLGCVPMDKLRLDHNLQDIRAKIFPFKKRKVESPAVMPSISHPAKRKERSLSSLVVSTPRVPTQTGVTGRRTRAGMRKAGLPRGTSPATEDPIKYEDEPMEDGPEGSSSPETLNKIIQNKKQVKEGCSSAKSSNDQTPGQDLENSNKPSEGKVDLWKPLTCLVEAANRTKFSRSNSQGQSHVKSEPSVAPDCDVSMAKIKTEGNGYGPEIQDDKNILPVLPGPAKRKRLHPGNRNREAASRESCNPPQLVLNASQCQRKDVPIWFSLVASEDLEGSAPLPQISAGFLRVKDGSMPVSSIQKYLVKKLDLTTEAEVQITCQGQPLLPSLQLRSLLDMWLRTAAPTSKRVRTAVGNSAKEFVMVLTYSRAASPAIDDYDNNNNNSS
ncbi:hypothetical protein Nepgr_009650 [Nepenthes gracilis]|uniref:RING-type domain-containing protein n=1 Tax=Nepenthes gracilis TaxID=150966 RepID=A0AAD3SBM5_NEPGR|nr:hypothetical protein Nepgr_009650 [Nepenthes gracilis]